MISIRNPNGYGSVYKLSGARRKPWVAAQPARPIAGSTRKKQIMIGTYATRKEAMQALAEWHSQEQPLIDIRRAEITLRQLHKEWTSVKYRTISQKTKESYDVAWNYLEPLYNAKVRNIRTAHFQQIIDQAAENGRSLSTLQKVRVLAGMLEGYAMQNDIIHKNYAEFITLPRGETKEKDRFSEEDMQKLDAAAAAGILHADIILIMCYTGWRIGELLALTRFNFDKQSNTLTGGIKTEAGKNRVVPVHPKVLPYLQRWLSFRADTIFFREEKRKDGTVLRFQVTPHYFRRYWFYPTLDALSIRRPDGQHFTPHATRHTFVSMLHKAGADKWDIQRLAGHSSDVVTNKTYTHVDQEQLRAAIDSLK